MIKKFLLSISGLALFVALTGVSYAQNTTTTVTKTVQNADGTYTVIQYPVGKEVMVDLMPGATMTGAKGIAHITRMGDETTINLDLSGLPADAPNYYVYAVDPAGAVTLLGPASIANGMSQVTYKTPMDKFMLVLSPNAGLSSIGSDTPVVFRSAVPQGYAVVNRTVENNSVLTTTGTKQVATGQTVSSTYDVPLLGVPSFTAKNTKIAIDFSPGFKGLRANTFVSNLNDGTHQIKMHFHNMQSVPNKRVVLWAVSPDKQYTKIGQTVSSGAKHEGEILGATALKDFGLFVTLEDTDVNQPASTIYSPFRIGVK
ncbi:MAG: hypothetical protein ACR2N3_06605 [Pyrinomonadaceae bacterium]